MKYLLIDTKSRSYKYGINWIGRLCIKYLKATGVICSQEYSSLTFEHFFVSGGRSAIRNINDPEKCELDFKQIEQ